MRKFFSSFAVVVLVVVNGACASHGYTGFTGVSFPGYEAAGVVAANQALIAAVASQQGWAYYGGGIGIPGFGNVPVCRLQDLQGLPVVSQPVLVRVPKSKGHRAMDVLYGAGIGAGAAYFLWKGGNWHRLVVGGATGASIGGLVASHEPAEYCLFLPVPRQ